MHLDKLNPKEFWDNRLKSNLNLQGTGHRAFNIQYNQWLYQAQQDSLHELLRKNKVNVSGKRILDIGSGTGFFVNYFLNQGGSSIFGIDISTTSVNYLQQTFPECNFAREDITSKSFFLNEDFDIISAISVLYHIVDDDAFHQAISNMCTHLSPGGYLIISDVFEQPILPTAHHTRHRSLAVYESEFRNRKLKTLELMPIYYLMNKTFIPVIGPLIVNFLKLGNLFYKMDKQFRKWGLNNKRQMKFLLARQGIAL